MWLLSFDINSTFWEKSFLSVICLQLLSAHEFLFASLMYLMSNFATDGINFAVWDFYFAWELSFNDKMMARKMKITAWK